MKVGILGGGQLGWMLARAGDPLGIRCRFLDPSPEAPAGRSGELVRAAYDDAEALDRFADRLAVVTYEFENVPVGTARRLAERLPVLPPPRALEVAQDRLAEKQFFESVGIPVAPWRSVASLADLDQGVAELGFPVVLKTRRLGYDGKGQHVIRVAADVGRAWGRLGGAPLVLEGFVRFARELSILAVRGRDGSTACYPLVENRHAGGILRWSLAPAPGVPRDLQDRGEDYARRVLDALGYVGVVAIELFQAGDGLLANEMAPRVHNSGHWTIEGAETSQFENHLRAVAGLPLGPTAPRGTSAMLNLIGALPDATAILAIPGAHLHLYGKDPRPGRKLGHVTVRADHPEELDCLRTRVEPLIPPDPSGGG
ncbi:MAG TPA: 5-(carboxyamino)imidazole ribonucleotide synthase [Methylomirabilota bacterium]|nr:5-(carboxyamino)imidazole ribonucleotide synthase [Methylomirabilota bacterium]